MYFWTLMMAFSLYTRIPVPGMDELKLERVKKDAVLCFFPLVGLVIGAAESILLYLMGHFFGDGEGAVIPTALLFCALPVLMTGGIHLDGLVDTADAKHSFLPKERKLQILEDPHVGAFGLIRLMLYLLILLAALILGFIQYTLDTQLLALPPLVFALSRALVGFSAQVLPKAKEEGMLAQVVGKKSRMPAVILFAQIALLFLLIFLWRASFGICLFIAFLAVFLYYRHMAIRQFGGVTGDLSGWFLCILELAAALTLALTPVVLRMVHVIRLYG